MRTIVLVLFSIVNIMEIFSQGKYGDRQPYAAGRFYSADKETLKKDVAQLFNECRKTPENGEVRAIIVPHAGYVYSGKIAAAGFSVTPKNASYENIFLIGSSHVNSFQGASVFNTGDYITPFGRAVVNREIADKLRAENKVFQFPVDVQLRDHNLEVQVPLIQYYYTNTPKIIPIVIGTDNTKTIKEIANALSPWFTSKNLFVISSDFSHYPPYKEAIENDNRTAEGLLTGDPDKFLAAIRKNTARAIPGLLTSMCGWTSGLCLLYLAQDDPALKFKRIDYCNSGDSQYGSKDEVVGYHAISLVDMSKKAAGGELNSEEFSFSKEEKDMMFSIARNTIKTMLYEKKRITLDENKIPAALRKKYGAFVTLKINGNLRGCIGRFLSEDPLYEVIKQSAISSAFEDPRFSPLTKADYEKTNIEITVLGPMKRIKDINEIILGKHGIYIKKDFRSGTMLPQVAIENNWTVEQFLGYTSRDKAGIGWDGWKSAELYIYEGLVLEENRK
jgi:AmmeMemoRadiSam system protein B/AmmeMemoRadiSam system protein A